MHVRVMDARESLLQVRCFLIGVLRTYSVVIPLVSFRPFSQPIMFTGRNHVQVTVWTWKEEKNEVGQCRKLSKRVS